LLFC
jgi:hypothetical protein